MKEPIISVSGLRRYRGRKPVARVGHALRLCLGGDCPAGKRCHHARRPGDGSHAGRRRPHAACKPWDVTGDRCRRGSHANHGRAGAPLSRRGGRADFGQSQPGPVQWPEALFRRGPSDFRRRRPAGHRAVTAQRRGGLGSLSAIGPRDETCGDTLGEHWSSSSCVQATVDVERIRACSRDFAYCWTRIMEPAACWGGDCSKNSVAGSRSSAASPTACSSIRPNRRLRIWTASCGK